MELVNTQAMNSPTRYGRRLDNVFDDFLGSFFGDRLPASMRGWNPTVDIVEQDDRIVLTADLPGVKKDDISLDVHGRTLILKGERSAGGDVQKGRYTVRERAVGRFQRSFTLPDETDVEKISASYKDGTLTLTIPKPEARRPRRITVH